MPGIPQAILSVPFAGLGMSEDVCPFNANVSMYSPTYGKCLAPTAVGIKINGLVKDKLMEDK